jgi:hypothetical protein
MEAALKVGAPSYLLVRLFLLFSPHQLTTRHGYGFGQLSFPVKGTALLCLHRCSTSFATPLFSALLRYCCTSTASLIRPRPRQPPVDMLSRGSSDAGTRLRRSKSTSTAYSHRTSALEPFDKDVAQQHALAAATAAFAKAHTSDTLDKTRGHSSELSRTKSNASRSSQGSHFPSRGSSLRTGANLKAAHVAGAGRQSRAPTITTVPATASQKATEAFPPYLTTPNTAKTLLSQPSTLNENTRPSSQPKPLEASVASQQIRKARSMYYASSIQTGSPIARPPVKYLTTPPAVSPPPDTSLLSARSVDVYSQRPRSSVVSPLASPRLPVTVALDESIDKARDRYLQGFQQQRPVKHKPSLFLAPFKKRNDKGKGRATPSLPGGISLDNHQTPGGISTDVGINDIKPPKEKRSFSGSLKDKFKKVFRRSSGKTTSLPVQQAEASRDYFGDRTASAGERKQGQVFSSDIPSPDEEQVKRFLGRSPSPEVARPEYVRSSSRDSNRSLHSEISINNTLTSRVTSWSSSSAGNTLTQRDIKRLTVIHEAKDSIGSNAEYIAYASPLRKPPPIPAFAAFRDPMPMASFVEDGATPVDPKRVFSALMKEIDTPKAQQPQESPADQSPSGSSDVFVSHAVREVHSGSDRGLYAQILHTGDSAEPRRPASYLRPGSTSTHDQPGYTKSSSLKSFGRAVKATIRAVTPSEHSTIPGLDPTGGVRNAPLGNDSSVTISEEVVAEDRTGSLGLFDFRLQPRSGAGEESPIEAFTPTTNPIESRAQKSLGRWKAPLDAENLPFFPRPTNRAYAVTNIAQTISPPQKRAVSQHVDDEGHISLEPPSQADASGSPHSSRARPLFSPLSPSVYSRNTDGMSIRPDDSVMSLGNIADDELEGGSAVIMTSSQAVKSYILGTPSPKRHTDSTSSSHDWKAWLSHEVSELGDLAHAELAIHDQYTTPTGHRREYTQISTDDTPPVYEMEGSPAFETEPTDLKTPTNRTVPEQVPTPDLPTPEPVHPSKTSDAPRIPLKTSPPPCKSFRPKSGCVSSVISAHSNGSSSSQKTVDGMSRARMNERFPYIDTRRTSSKNSSMHSSMNNSPSSGGGSSSSNGTPNPKIYSDLSAPSSNRGSAQKSNARTKRAEVHDGIGGKQKENATPVSVERKSALTVSLTTPSMSRPVSLQPLPSSSLKRTRSSLAEYVTTGSASTDQTPDSATPRLRMRPHPITLGNLSIRPKSAFDLRGSTTSLSPNPLNPTSSDSPLKRNVYQPSPAMKRKPATVRPLEGDTIRMLIESPWAISGSPSPRSSPRSSPVDPNRPALHVKHSSSTLAFNKEPSPGSEDRYIDSLLGDERENYLSRRGGSTTPGQRMADRFLRQRTGRSQTESPVSVVGAQEARSATGSPAFI